MSDKFRFHSIEECRVYYTRGAGLYCYQLNDYVDGKAVYKFFRCTEVGEPIYEVAEPASMSEFA